MTFLLLLFGVAVRRDVIKGERDSGSVLLKESVRM